MAISVPTLSISPVLREAAELKIEEFNRSKAALKNRYQDNAAVAAAGDDTLNRLHALLEQIKKFDPYLETDDDLTVLSRYVEQAKNDRSVSQAKLMRFEKELLDKLDKYTNCLEVSSLHIALLEEALRADDSPASVSAKLEKAALDDEFEMVEAELEAVFEKFEKNTFATKDIDAKDIEDYLSGLFDDSAAKEQLDELRRGMKIYGNNVMTGSEKVDEEIVTWCIADLLRSGLLGDDKKKALQGYLQTPLAVRELVSTLNMKSVRHWNWRNAEKGLPVMARQNAEGKYCITVEEDIIDMLFLHSLAVAWSMRLRESLKDMISYKDVWPGNRLLTAEEFQKRNYYLFGFRPPFKSKSKSRAICHDPPPPPAPFVEAFPPPPRGCPPPPLPPPPPPPPAPVLESSNVSEERDRNYIKDFFVSRLPKRDGSSPDSVSANKTQTILLKTLATEAKLREALDGSAHGVMANFNSFASSLPHQTILAVLKFIGVPEQWLEVFTRFLAAPLNMGAVSTRTCGVPIARGLETFFGEAVLFFLDLVVHKKTGAYLYRIRDKCYFVGKAEQCTEVINQMFRFANAMGLSLSMSDSLDGEPIGFLTLGVRAGQPVTFSIDDAKVESYARRVKKQLAACSTVIEWIRLWNDSVGTYASHLFGPLANVFGKAHLEAVIQAYNRMHEIIFDGGNLTDHVKKLLAAHLGCPLSDPPFAVEALIYLPHACGGLGIKNPYVTLNIAHGMLEKPASELEKYLDDEKKYYDYAAENFNRMTRDRREQKLHSIFDDDKERIAKVLGADTDPAVFLSMAELISNRERTAYPFLPPPPSTSASPAPLPDLIHAYKTLLEEPTDHIIASEWVNDEVYRLRGRLDMRRWRSFSGEERWVLQMYGNECFERYGGLEIWHRDSVPMEVLKMVRGEEEDEADDTSSCSFWTDP